MNDINPTILVADDDPFSVDILLEYLEDTGYAVETVADGPTSWRLLEANADGYDVAIPDRAMPPAAPSTCCTRPRSASNHCIRRAIWPHSVQVRLPDPRRVVSGLSELLVNAVEHGNLGISCAEKRRLREQNRWEQEVDACLADTEHAHKEVSVRFWREPDRTRVVIQDQGNGFDWQRYLETDPARALATHGCGIAMSCMISFDRIEYREKGNQVEVSVNIPAG